MKIVLRQITVSLVAFGRTPADALTSALQIHDHQTMNLLKSTVEPLNPAQNKETADLFMEFMKDTGRMVAGFHSTDNTDQAAYTVTLIMEDSVTWQPRPNEQAELPLGEGGGMAGTTVGSSGGDEAGRPSPDTAPASGQPVGEDHPLATERAASTDPNDRDPNIVQGLPPEAVAVGEQPVGAELETVPTPGQN